ncbi:hypothetical protein Golob_025424, partial [Gossypium lobatum]|nr:hypothetical protein [Gossypium lobatum]
AQNRTVTYLAKCVGYQGSPTGGLVLTGEYREFYLDNGRYLERILRILMARCPYNEHRVWRGEASAECSVRSGYKLLTWEIENELPTCLTEFAKSVEYFEKKDGLVTENFIKNYLKELDNLSNKLLERIEVTEDSRGYVIDSKIVINKKILLAFATKALACIQAMWMDLDQGIRAMEVEEDLLTVVKKAQMDEEDRSAISAYIKDAKSL